MMIKDIKNNLTPKSWDNLPPLSSPSQLGVTLGDDTMKHTKGKWDVNESDGVLTIVCTDLNNRKYYIGDVNGDADYEPTYRANANLIAAAPELLRTIKPLIARIKAMDSWAKDYNQVKEAEEAIAKAEGK